MTIYKIKADVDNKRKTFLSMTNDKEKIKANFPKSKVEIISIEIKYE